MDKGHILVVDDEPNARNALAELLRGDGYRVETASDGLEALGKLRECEPDIVLTDLKMPRMDGLELLRQLRARPHGGVVVVVMTAFGAVDSAVSAMKEGAMDYLTKPIRLDDVLPVLERGMEQRRLRHQAEQAKRQLEAANHDLNAFAHRVAHDLRTPLAPIALLADSLKDRSDDPTVLRAADRIAANACRAAEMIDGLLTFSRLGRAIQGAATAAAAVVRQSLDDFARPIVDDEVTVEVDLDDEAAVACDASLFRQIVDNLVGNALKHLKGRQRRSLHVHVRGSDGFVDLEVADSGPGIPASSTARIFEPFYRVPGNQRSGTGLGLATVRRIVEAHGGQITLRSVLDEGTSFRVRLPAAVRPTGMEPG